MSFKLDCWYSRGYLPHFDDGESSQAITFRLADSMPQNLIRQWQEEFEYNINNRLLRQRVQKYLDMGYGNCWLGDERIASLVQDSFLHFDDERYRLLAWVIMPNHVHLLLAPINGHKIEKILQSLKSYTAHQACKILNIKDHFWQKEYYDRYIRDYKHFSNALSYVENNPVKAGLCENPDDWLYSSARFRT